jgi:hypothetical protein
MGRSDVFRRVLKIILANIIRIADTMDVGFRFAPEAPQRRNMKLLFPVVFGLFVFYVFAWPQFEAAQNHVAHLVTIAVSR